MTNSVRLFAPPMLSQSPGPRNLRNCENETPRRCLTLLTVTCPDDFPHDTNPTSCSQHDLNLHLVSHSPRLPSRHSPGAVPRLRHRPRRRAARGGVQVEVVEVERDRVSRPPRRPPRRVTQGGLREAQRWPHEELVVVGRRLRVRRLRHMVAREAVAARLVVGQTQPPPGQGRLEARHWSSRRKVHAPPVRVGTQEVQVRHDLQGKHAVRHRYVRSREQSRPQRNPPPLSTFSWASHPACFPGLSFRPKSFLGGLDNANE